MKQVYQQIISSENGDCMKATLCSLLELEYDSVCNFVEYDDWWQRMESVLNDNGYEWGTRFFNEKKMDLWHPTDCFRPYLQLEEGLRLSDIMPEDTIDVFLFGSVLSPHYYNSQNLDLGLHMVVIDANCNIVFDPNPEYAGIDHYPLSRLLDFNGVLEAWGVKKQSNNKGNVKIKTTDMGLNETLDRLQREREKREQEMKLMKKIADLPLPDEKTESRLDAHVREYAERIFFGRMLKDINNGMSEPKIDALIERSIMIATRLAHKLYT